MSASQLLPVNGAVTFPNSLVADYGSFSIEESQGVESVCSYGAQVYDAYRGSGTPHAMINTAAFAKGHAASTNPFGSGGGLTSGAGASGTWTIDTGFTYVGVMVIQSVTLSHARLRAAIPLSFVAHCGADPTVTWATS